MTVLLDHVTIRVRDRTASERIYAELLGVLGFHDAKSGPVWTEWENFGLAEATAEKPPTLGLHVGFTAGSRGLVDEFWRAGLAAGLRDDGEPGERAQYRDDYYGAFLLDLDGNSIEAVHHGALADSGCVDHVWLRVSDLHRSQQFYALVGEFARFEPRESAHGVHWSGKRTDGSFSTVSGTPGAEAHLAFTAPDTAAVDAFHAAAVAAGHPDNGAPGERPEYHAGYYGAFVLDPDGNNIELVVTRTAQSPAG